jgi:hypothetical protein
MNFSFESIRYIVITTKAYVSFARFCILLERTGFLQGKQIATLLARFDLSKAVLAEIWSLAVCAF